MATKEVYQVQVNVNKCGWMEIVTREEREEAEKELDAAKRRCSNSPMFEHRIQPVIVVLSTNK